MRGALRPSAFAVLSLIGENPSFSIARRRRLMKMNTAIDGQDLAGNAVAPAERDDLLSDSSELTVRLSTASCFAV